ncbi:uncharacterized membrane protein YbhN (UPF0104 family) [Natronocella acetinitrilica]|uniref:Uncharacterized membrane protein YbhN (UPF0104 family) n=1 Tax=Natronocella acetinitrilica TaxID=414046 RepID=A0AAE3G129_9GAMM|nr:lysylphosphatidylglycerol synthase transmembrane domain-containing protein [Natronocella acetinitrilica]MCP1673472.1 uncharacterized membrane protein YbhN (UPF0104 family) [Natronocella acetinitrilica]
MNGHPLAMIARMAVSLGLLLLLAWLLDPAVIVSTLAGLHPGWVTAALAITIAQTLLSAWRWRYTASRLRLAMPVPFAVREYYLASFINQVLPGGVLGDVARAWRHAGRAHRRRAAVHGVILERGSGQLAMALIAVASLLVLADVLAVRPYLWVHAGLLACMLTWFALGKLLWQQRSGRALVLDLRRALLNRNALPVQLFTSLTVVLSYLLVYLAAARAVGDATPTLQLLPLIPLVLLAMLIPVSFAGWGLREGAAAAIWALAGLDPAQGVAIAIAYGLLVLAGTLPGALVLWMETRRRTALVSPS